jgi:hypothetical protein
MSKLLRAQEVVIDSSLSEKDVPTNKEIVSNTLGSVDNTSIDQAHNINRNIKLPKRNCANKFSNGKRANPVFDVAAPIETKQGENIPTRKSSRIASYYSDCDFAKFKVSTHMASAISSDNPFVMLALVKFKKLSLMIKIFLNIF